MSMSWRELGEAIDRMETHEADGDAHIRAVDGGTLRTINDIKVAEKSLNDEEPSVIFLTLFSE